MFLTFILVTLFLFNNCRGASQDLTLATIHEICALLQSGSTKDYIGEPISQLEHALQCAQRAKDAGADQETIIAALLHDIGHLCAVDADTMQGYGVARHEIIGAQYVLAHGFSNNVAELIKGHVEAKRYLTYKDSGYYEKLSDASKKTLKMQDGHMTQEEAFAFENDPLFKKKLQIRFWDEQAKEIDCVTDPLESYNEILLRNCTIIYPNT